MSPLLITVFVKDGGGFGESQAFFYDLLILFVWGGLGIRGCIVLGEWV